MTLLNLVKKIAGDVEDINARSDKLEERVARLEFR
jgi:hypothetical protein